MGALCCEALLPCGLCLRELFAESPWFTVFVCVFYIGISLLVLLRLGGWLMSFRPSPSVWCGYCPQCKQFHPSGQHVAVAIEEFPDRETLIVQYEAYEEEGRIKFPQCLKRPSEGGGRP